jgi:hypothetical protein
MITILFLAMIAQAQGPYILQPYTCPKVTCPTPTPTPKILRTTEPQPSPTPLPAFVYSCKAYYACNTDVSKIGTATAYSFVADDLAISNTNPAFACKRTTNYICQPAYVGGRQIN